MTTALCRRTSIEHAAAARRTYCHHTSSAMRQGNGGAQDRADRGGAGAAQERPRECVLAEGVEVAASEDDEEERRGEGNRGREQRPADTCRRVADGRHRVGDRAWCDLPQRDGVQELRIRHPVVAVDGVVLHERDDHEAASVGERADLERDPGEREEAARRCGDGRHDRNRREGSRPQVASRDDLGDAAGNQNRERARRRSSPPPRRRGRRRGSSARWIARDACSPGAARARPGRRPLPRRLRRPRRLLASTAVASGPGRAKRAQGSRRARGG